MSETVDVSVATAKAMEQAKLAGLSPVSTIVDNVQVVKMRGRRYWKVRIRSGGVMYTASIEHETGKVIGWRRGT